MIWKWKGVLLEWEGVLKVGTPPDAVPFAQVRSGVPAAEVLRSVFRLARRHTILLSKLL